MALVLALAGAPALPSAAAQCPPPERVVARADAVVVGRVAAVLRERARVAAGPRIAGTSPHDDLVAIEVVEVLKGRADAQLQMLCPGGDLRCRPGGAGDLLIAIGSAQPNPSCALWALDTVPGAHADMRDIERARALRGQLRRAQ